MPDGNQVSDAAARAPAVTAEAKALNLHQRLLAVMGEVDYVQKDRHIGGSGGGYKVVTHDAVTAKVRPALVKHRVVYYPQNLAYVQNGNRTEITVDIKFVNADVPDDFILVPTLGFGIDNQDKGPGKSISYAVKMALLKALGLETGEDADDGANVDHKPHVQPAAQAPVDYDKQKNAPGISAAKQRMRDIIHELNGISDEPEFTAYLPGIKEFCVEVCGKWPQQWIGPEDGSGLKGQIEVVAKQLGISQPVGKWLGKVELTAKAQSITE